MEYYSLENCPCVQTKLLTALNQPLNQHLSHLSVRIVDIHGEKIHAFCVGCA